MNVLLNIKCSLDFIVKIKDLILEINLSKTHGKKKDSMREGKTGVRWMSWKTISKIQGKNDKGLFKGSGRGDWMKGVDWRDWFEYKMLVDMEVELLSNNCERT